MERRNALDTCLLKPAFESLLGSVFCRKLVGGGGRKGCYDSLKYVNSPLLFPRFDSALEVQLLALGLLLLFSVVATQIV